MFVIFLVMTIFIVLAIGQTFRAGYQRQAEEITKRQALTTAQATLRIVESELNTALWSAVYASAYEIGMAAEDRVRVERRVVELLNDRISAGWYYSNLETISVPPCDNLIFRWLPDGSVEVVGYLPAFVEHAMGPRAHGIRLSVSAVPRFERLRYLANRAYELAFYAPDLGDLERELNGEFEPEGFRFTIEPGPSVTVEDLWAAKRVIV
jgi:hypothetical protein